MMMLQSQMAEAEQRAERANAEAARLREALEDILAAEDRDGIAITGMRERFARARKALAAELDGLACGAREGEDNQ